MEVSNDTGTQITYNSYELHKDDRRIAKIITYDPDGDAQIVQLFNQDRSLTQ